MKRVITGISGGIDSAVAAFLLKEKGYEVIGIHIRVGDFNNSVKERLHKIEHVLDIPIRVIDARKRFNASVLHHFREEHLAGRSPSPCAICNPAFKWKILEEEMLNARADGIASGHYIQKEFRNGAWHLKIGADTNKDQSYFLWGLGQDIISRLVAPLGKNGKMATRELALKSELGFLSNLKESTGLCFSEGLGHTDLIEKFIPEARDIGSGPVKDGSGNIVGSHKGYIYYTIGQKKGLLLNDNNNLCVTQIIAKENTLIVSSPKSLWKKSFVIGHIHFIDLNSALKCKKLQVKVRGFGWNPEGYSVITPLSKDKFLVELEKPAWAPAPGQPAVFYEDGLLLGGGIIS